MCGSKSKEDSGNDAINNGDTKTPEKWKPTIVWTNVIVLAIFHVLGVIGFYQAVKFAITNPNPWKGFGGFALNFLHGITMGIGITAGAHRLWCHRSYKANVPLRLLLMVFQTWAVQNSIHEWVRDHRVHHKFTDSNADPHNINRGFWFAHVGWLCTKKHPDVMRKGKTVEMDDLEADWVVMFQKKNYFTLLFLFVIILPMWFNLKVLDWPFWTSFGTIPAKLVTAWNVTWCLNSFSHIFGVKPFDRFQSSTDSALMGWMGLGEGWHNYHHVFPWDYKTSELLDYRFNLTNFFIDFMAWIGWATELKVVSEKMIKQRVLRTGDGSWSKLTKEELLEYVNTRSDHTEQLVWGFEDKDMKPFDKELCDINQNALS